MARLIQPKDTICYFTNHDEYRFIVVDQKTKIKLGKNFYSAEPLLGKPYGSSFRVENNVLTLYFENNDTTELPAISGENNKNLTQDGKAQKLSTEEITELKNKGAAPDDIIQALCQNSSTFHTKTKFSQEKYLKKKTKKYSQVIKVLPPNLRSITWFYFQKDPQKIGELREDSLGLLLTLANVRSSAKLGVIDNCSGLVVSACLDRLSGEGKVVNFYTEVEPTIAAIKLFNFSDYIQKPLVHFPLSEVERAAPSFKPSLFLSNSRTSSPSESLPSSTYSHTQNNSEEVLQTLSLDGLLIAANYNPIQLLKILWPLLSYSSPFAIFSPSIMPLSECHKELRESEEVVELNVEELWTREYQVLPQRTHPTMRMHGASGYVLSGIKVPPASRTNATPTTAPIQTTSNLVRKLDDDHEESQPKKLKPTE